MFVIVSSYLLAKERSRMGDAFRPPSPTLFVVVWEAATVPEREWNLVRQNAWRARSWVYCWQSAIAGACLKSVCCHSFFPGVNLECRAQGIGPLMMATLKPQLASEGATTAKTILPKATNSPHLFSLLSSSRPSLGCTVKRVCRSLRNCGGNV